MTHGHFGDGCVHIRIDFDLVRRDGVAANHRFIEQGADLVAGHSRGDECCCMSNPGCAEDGTDHTMSAMTAETAGGVHRIVAILRALGEYETAPHGSAGVVEVARAVGREKSQVSRALRSLADSGLVDRDPDSLEYRLGWRFFALAAHAGEHQLLATAPAVLRGLVRTVGERAHLTVLSGDEVLTLLSESPSRAVQAAGWVGRVTPLYCTSSGRALLFDHDEMSLRELLSTMDFEPRGPKAPKDAAEVITRVRGAARRGYAPCIDEFEEGLAAVAAPVRDFRGRVVAAVNVSGPKFRIGRTLHAVGRNVRSAADYLTRNLGGAVSTAPRRSS